MTGLVFGLEWSLALTRRRLFALNALVPLAVTVPIAASRAPSVHAVAVYAVLFVLFGTFGSAIPLVRDAERGMVARIARTRIGPGRYLLERAAAGASVDLVQLTPALLAVGVLGGRPGALPGALVVLAGTLLVTDLLGTWVAALARSLGEGALFSAVTGLLLLHASGVFRTPAPGSWGARVEAASPFRALHEALAAVAGPGPGRPLAAGNAPEGTAALAVWLGAGVVITALAAPALVSRLAHPDGAGLVGRRPGPGPGRIS